MKKNLFLRSLWMLCVVTLFYTQIGYTKCVNARIKYDSCRYCACEDSQRTEMQTDKAILVVSFGTSHADTRKLTIDACINKIKDNFEEYEIRKAFTSNIIIKILKNRDNIEIDTVEKALQKLKDEKFNEVIVQPLHIINGKEYHDIIETTAKFKDAFVKIEVGSPLLTSIEDYKAVAYALKKQTPILKENEAVVFMGHGTHHFANASYACLERIFETEKMQNFFIGTVEGFPEISHVMDRLKSQGVDKVILMPLMLVAGDHAKNDMAGDEEDSWKSVIEKENIEVEIYLHGLGENPAIQELYVQHVNNIIEK